MHVLLCFTADFGEHSDDVLNKKFTSPCNDTKSSMIPVACRFAGLVPVPHASPHCYVSACNKDHILLKYDDEKLEPLLRRSCRGFCPVDPCTPLYDRHTDSKVGHCTGDRRHFSSCTIQETFKISNAGRSNLMRIPHGPELQDHHNQVIKPQQSPVEPLCVRNFRDGSGRRVVGGILSGKQIPAM